MNVVEVDIGSHGPVASMPRRARPAVPDKGAVRRCIVTGHVRPKSDLVRFAIDGEGRLVPDLETKLPGRGLWVTADRAHLEQACRRKLFARAAKRAVNVPDDLPDQVASLQRRRGLAMVGLARRSGRLVAGFEKVRARLKAAPGPDGVLVEARDGARGGREKLTRLSPSTRVVACFAAAELGAALGRGETVHAWVEAGPLADRLVAAADRIDALEAAADSAGRGPGDNNR